MTDATEPDEGAPEVGSVAEEAAKLFGALGDWARTASEQAGHAGHDAVADLADQAGQALRDVDEHLATGSAECRYCPLCRTVHVFRQASPEVRAHLTTAALSLVAAAQGMLATQVPPTDGDGLEHIDLDEEAWEDE